jgi:hypothetical protein
LGRLWRGDAVALLRRKKGKGDFESGGGDWRRKVGGSFSVLCFAEGDGRRMRRRCCLDVMCLEVVMCNYGEEDCLERELLR